MIKILNSGFTKLGVIKNAITSTRMEEINGENILDFEAVLDQKLNTLIDENSIYEFENDWFDTAYIKKQIKEDNTFSLDVQAEHISYRLNREEYNKEYFTETGNPTYILGKILEGTGFTVGTVEFSSQYTYSAQEAKSRRQLLMEFVAYVEGEVSFNKFQVNIHTHRGSTTNKTVIKDRNVKIVAKIVDKKQKDKDGNVLTSYTCTPLYLPGDVYNLGDNITLMQKDLAIQENLRVVSISRDVYDTSVATLQFSKYINGLEQSLYQIQTDSVVKDALMNGIRIGPEYGFEAVRNDKKARAYFRSDSMALQSGDGSGTTWKNRLYYDYNSETDETILVFDGILSASIINALKVLITPNLYAGKATIAELTVDELDTSDKIRNFLESNTADVNYQRIYDQFHKYITAHTDGSSYSQATDRYGAPLYWIDNKHEAATTEETDFPVYVYDYTEMTKLEIAFEGEGVKVPKITLGTGTGAEDPDWGKVFVYKQADGFYIDYINGSNGTKYTFKITDDGIDFSGFPSITYEENVVINGLVQIWVQDDPPLAAKVKDIWVDTDDYSRYDKLEVSTSHNLAVADPEVIFMSGYMTVLTLHPGTHAGIISKIYNVGTYPVHIEGTLNGIEDTDLYLMPGESVELVTTGSGWTY